MKNEWYHSRNGENFSSSAFSTKEEAIADGKEYHDGESFWVGQSAPYEDYLEHFDADTVFDDLVNNACEEVGEVAEDWLDNIAPEEKMKLQDVLNAALVGWMKETKEEPIFYRIINIEKVDFK